MTRVFIIEDEAPARERLAAMVPVCDPSCQVVGTADSVAAARSYLAEHAAPDLILADIELGDGRSLDLFRAHAPSCPVIFVTAHDAYLLDAFATNGIAYLLKPIKSADLVAALNKYRELGQHYTAQFATWVRTAQAGATNPGRQRILAQRGRAFQPVALSEVAYFLSENKLTFLVTRAGERCLVNETLATLEAELSPKEFFRLNRTLLVQAKAVKQFSSMGKGRLSVQLQPPVSEEVLVSQENAAAFREWVGR